MSFRHNIVALDGYEDVEEGALAAAYYPGVVVVPKQATGTLAVQSRTGLGGIVYVLLEDNMKGSDATVQIASGELGRAAKMTSGKRSVARIKNNVTTTVDAALAFHNDGTLKLAAAASGDTIADVQVAIALEAVASPSSGTPAQCAVRWL
jgi:hypothetical protein